MNRIRRIVTAAAALAILVAALPAFAADAGKVNLNEATLAQLELLPRVGPSVAARIVEFREKNGPFKKIEDVMLVRGIGERSFEHMKPYLAVSGETTLKESIRTAHFPAKKSAPSRSGN